MKNSLTLKFLTGAIFLVGSWQLQASTITTDEGAAFSNWKKADNFLNVLHKNKLNDLKNDAARLSAYKAQARNWVSNRNATFGDPEDGNLNVAKLINLKR
uniref:hypothetical protein n=1 Tax=Deinococcus sp. TaxID=47478 RepID=UPI00286E516E